MKFVLSLPQQTLLGDTSHVVRSIAVTGICNILTSCWDLLSSDQIKTFVSILIQKLAWDASSADVRLAVVKASGFLAPVQMTFPQIEHGQVTY